MQHQSSIDAANDEFINNPMLQQLHAVLTDQKYLIMQKLILKVSIDKLFNGDYNELKESAVYQSFKSRAV